MVSGVDDMDKVKEGDILVTNMTVPELISAMVRAGGYITNIGGITCHAAVVAREYKKPCVVGTTYATSKLKDGIRVRIVSNPKTKTGEVYQIV